MIRFSGSSGLEPLAAVELLRGLEFKAREIDAAKHGELTISDDYLGISIGSH